MLSEDKLSSFRDELFMLARFDWNRVLGFMKLFGHYDCGGSGAGRDKKGRQKPTISVAGYLATAGQWWEHHRLWCKRLVKEGFVKNGYPHFHMTDFMATSKIFEKCKKWSEDRKLEFLDDLIDITVKNVTVAIGMAVRRADYDQMLLEEPHATLSVFASPYTFCVFRCFESGADWSIKHRSRETINYIFEQGDEGAKQVCDTYNFLCEFEPLRRRFWLGSLTCEPKSNTSLQAADLLTWALNRELYHQEYPEPDYDVRLTLNRLLTSVDNIYKGYNKDDLLGYLDDMFKRPKGKFFIVNVPEHVKEELRDEVKARLDKRSADEEIRRVSKVRRNNARTASRTQKRVTKGTSKRRTNKGTKKKAG